MRPYLTTLPPALGVCEMGNELYQRTITFDYGDPERRSLVEKVWSGTPWMVNAYTGSCGDDRDCEMRDWCFEHFGNEAWPIHGKPGKWHRSGATINGWTWFGFATQEMMRRFEEAFPSPPSKGGE